MAVNCGTPEPDIILVVHTAEGPMPTFKPSAPAKIKSRAASAVAILPAIKSTCGKLYLNSFICWIANSEWQCAISKIITSAPASISALDLSRVSFTPTAAPTRRRPFPSLDALGHCSSLRKSLVVINPRTFLFSNNGSFSMRYLWRISLACCNPIP